MALSCSLVGMNGWNQQSKKDVHLDKIIKEIDAFGNEVHFIKMEMVQSIIKPSSVTSKKFSARKLLSLSSIISLDTTSTFISFRHGKGI